jgi:hypothetical protein
MKFLGAVAAYLIMAFMLGWGILLAVNGSFWLLAAGLVAYAVAFVKIGCWPRPESH